ncbi:hypothetical protein B0H14DRAFT_3523082 [Mycena olivaceomarginata]|nr:hypothetical protein B0H14DRAFT_3523082 [Mycena olivaceomarginata]
MPTISETADLTPTSPLSRLLFPADPAQEDHSWMAENEWTIASILRCVESGSCSQNQTKVVILAANPFRGVLRGDNGGEAIWANSTVIALRRLGYSFLYASSRDHMSQLYYMFRRLVSAIFEDVPDVMACFHDQDCVLREHRPHGIPAWKLFSFHFWGTATASNLNVRPDHSSRTISARIQAYVYAKDARYFNGTASAAAGVQFLAGVHDHPLPEFFPSNITNVGFMPTTEFYGRVAESRVLVGVGRPTMHRTISSPTPYEALCLGVPFINPILSWDKNDPTNKTRWNSQHDTLKHLDPPYVYNVFKGDKEGFVNAVVDASSHPIESFVLDGMRMSSVEARVAAIMETNWKAEAAELLAERKASGSGEKFWL